MNTPSVSVVIPTYRRRRHLAGIVAAVAADPYPREIVVVVDGSADGSLELLRELAVGEPRIVPLWQDNRGQGAARQAGVERATGEVVLLLDDDVLAGPGLAAGHARAHAGRERAVVLGYMPTRRPEPRGPGDYPAWLYAEDYERACAAYEADPGSVITHLWAGNLSLRRADALAVGLDGGPGLVRHEDRAFGLRCARAGLTGVFDRSLAATHLHGQSPAGFRRQFFEQGRSRRKLASLFPEYVTAVDPLTQVPGRLRTAVSLLTAAGAPARALLRGGIRAAGAVHAWGPQIAGARLLRQVELARGFRQPEK
ncbi:glycosyltransferase family 2 protein [Dactylosporangium sp. CA-233914]|uniref:glycosyltransferase family 2 protein n=1 Tax=Dactylosporangium sp. CA-233914 TaxID=3239934 RepID=UPI003D92B5B2